MDASEPRTQLQVAAHPQDYSTKTSGHPGTSKMTPTACCEIGSEYAETGIRRTDIQEEAARAHAEEAFCHDELAEVLRACPQIIDGWLLWSCDKRWTPAWYFSDEPRNTFLVGYCAANLERQTETRYQDGYIACAAYIVRELEDYKRILVAQGKW
jgi:hypothetical protein